MPRFPQAALLVLILSHASRHDRRPTEVWEDYLAHPREYQLVWTFEAWRAEREQEEVERLRRR